MSSESNFSNFHIMSPNNFYVFQKKIVNFLHCQGDLLGFNDSINISNIFTECDKDNTISFFTIKIADSHNKYDELKICMIHPKSEHDSIKSRYYIVVSKQGIMEPLNIYNFIMKNQTRDCFFGEIMYKVEHLITQCK